MPSTGLKTPSMHCVGSAKQGKMRRQRASEQRLQSGSNSQHRMWFPSSEHHCCGPQNNTPHKKQENHRRTEKTGLVGVERT